MAGRGATTVPFTTKLTDFDDALIKRDICTREQCLLAKGMDEEQVLDLLVHEDVTREMAKLDEAAREVAGQAQQLEALAQTLRMSVRGESEAGQQSQQAATAAQLEARSVSQQHSQTEAELRLLRRTREEQAEEIARLRQATRAEP